MNEKYINEIIKLSNKAKMNGDVPVGAIIIYNDRIIARAYNKKFKNKTSIDHAEIIAIKKACRKLKTSNLKECEMYISLEPCNMCKEAIKESRIKQTYYLLDSKYYNNKINKINLSKLISKKENEYLNIINEFFSKLR